MVRQTKNFRKGGLAKKVLSAILAASMIMTSSTFAMAASEEPVEVVEDVAVAETADTLEGATITVADVTYNGKAQEPKVEVCLKDAAEALDESAYTVTYSDNTNVGTATATVTLKATGETAEQTFNIAELVINADNTKVVTDRTAEAYSYNQKKQEPKVLDAVVKTVDGEIALSAEDYDVVAEGDDVNTKNCTADGNPLKFKLVAKGNFTGEFEIASYAITPVELTSDLVSVTVKDTAFDNNVKTLTAAVINNVVVKENESTDDVPVTVQFQNEKGEWVTEADNNIGVHKLRVVPTKDGNYEDGSVEAEYKIVASASLEMMTENAKVVEDSETNFVDNVTTYNGKDHWNNKIDSVSVKNLVEGTDFEVVTEKTEWINAGTYTLDLVGKNVYAGQTAQVTVKIEAKKLTDDMVSATQSKHPQSEKYGDVVVKVADSAIQDAKGEEKVLVEGVDYEWTKKPAANDKDGKVSIITIKGLGNYETKASDFLVDVNEAALSLNDPSIKAEVKGTYKWTGEKIVVDYKDIVVVDEVDGYTLKLGKDYKITENDNINPGKATVTIEGMGAYSGELNIPFTIEGVSFADKFMTSSVIEDQKNGYVLNTTDLKNKIKVQYQSTGARYYDFVVEVYDAKDKLVADKTALDPGVYTVKIKSNEQNKGYEDSIDLTFTVLGVDVSKTAKVAAIEDQVYTGKEIEPAVKVTVKKADKDIVLEAGKDYTVAYEDNLNAGVAKAIITFTGEYSGTIEKTFNITQAQQEVTLDAAQVKGLENRTTMNKDCTMKLTYALEDATKQVTYTTSDPKVATVNNGVIRYQGVGKAIITVTVADSKNCKGTSLDVEVNVTKPGKPSFTPTGKTKGFIATSSTVRGAQGWQVQYSTNKALVNGNTKGSYTRTFSSVGAKLSRAMNKVSYSKATYYVRVRCYQTVNGKKVYSSWSNVKSVKTK